MAGWSLLGAAVVYAWGVFMVLGVYDVEELCGRYGQHWEFDPAHRESLFPPSSPCNPSYDLVPPYLTPVFFTLLTLAAVSTTIAITRKLNPSPP
ncbi:hypothetical protein [Nocardia sp. NRRL S-836]|uniref:hypothetical protein n=1 Tax=Nocardia sp. NRRL S-836 TaxID=1519492 RepID=UPI0012F79E49|nr:hypothetical protein [Nocardia sp. NRRL S-836]